MQLITLFKVSIISSLIIDTVGATLKILHWPGANIVLGIGLLFSIFFILIALKHLFTKYKPSLTNKILWSIGLLIFPTVCGIAYYFLVLRKDEQYTER